MAESQAKYYEMKTSHFLPPLFSILCCAVTLTAQPDSAKEKKPSVFETLTEKEGAILRLETDFTYFHDRNTKEKFSGVLSSDEGYSYHIQLEKRGKFRLRGGALPPLKLNFSKKDLLAAGLDTLDEIKLVVPYTLDKKGNELVFREYLAYRMFECLSPYSIRARFIQVAMTDVHAGKECLVYCILLEDKEETISRLGGVLVDEFNLEPDRFDKQQLALVGLFQYMIGNTDWSLSMKRNVQFAQVPGQEKLVVLPYDFDFSGLVNAFYAIPSLESGLPTVRQRWFMVDQLSKEELDHAIQRLAACRTSFEELCHSAYLSNTARKDMIRFLDKFYQDPLTCKTLNCSSEAKPEGNWSMND